MRLFAALALPDAARQELAEVIPAPPPGARAVPAARWHITLAFYGQLTDAALIGDAIDRRLPRRGPVGFEVRGGGVFHGGAAHVDVAGASDEWDRLLRDLVRACNRAGLACRAPGARQRERFRPHLTVARMRRGCPVPQSYIGELGKVEAGPWSAIAVELIESFLGPQPRYEVRRRFPLLPAVPYR